MIFSVRRHPLFLASLRLEYYSDYIFDEARDLLNAGGTYLLLRARLDDSRLSG
jgi:hypothetical protein